MAPVAQAGMLPGDLRGNLDRLLSKAYPAYQPGAAALISVGDRVILRKGYGMADLERGLPMRPDRQFRIASISKQFTAVAVLQLAAAGQLNLDDDAAQYVPELRDRLPDAPITIRQLLTHTSGLKNYSDLDSFRDQPTRTMSVGDLLALAARQGLRFKPGTAWEYSNTGYVLLAAIVQHVSGMPFGRYVQTRVIAPAGLTHTFVGNAATGEGPGIAGYVPVIGRPGHFERAVTLNLSQAIGAGSLISCVDDLWQWDRAVQAGRVLPSAWVKQAQTPVALQPQRSTVPAGRLAFGDAQATGTRPYGYGWELQTISHHATVGHGGTLSGYRSFELEVPDLGLFVAILCNCDRPVNDPAQVAAKVIAALERG
jgi:D-alanyl-D-alanine carboxypeptidase